VYVFVCEIVCMGWVDLYLCVSVPVSVLVSVSTSLSVVMYLYAKV